MNFKTSLSGFPNQAHICVNKVASRKACALIGANSHYAASWKTFQVSNFSKDIRSVFAYQLFEFKVRRVVDLTCFHSGIALAFQQIGLCLYSLRRFTRAIRAQRQALFFARLVAHHHQRDALTFRALTNLGLCYLDRADGGDEDDEGDHEPEDEVDESKADEEEESEHQHFDRQGALIQIFSLFVFSFLCLCSVFISSKMMQTIIICLRNVAMVPESESILIELSWKVRSQLLSHRSESMQHLRSEFFAKQVIHAFTLSSIIMKHLRSQLNSIVHSTDFC